MYCSYVILCYSAFGIETIPADLSSFKPVEKEWQSQLVSNFIDQVCMYVHGDIVYM